MILKVQNAAFLDLHFIWVLLFFKIRYILNQIWAYHQVAIRNWNTLCRLRYISKKLLHCVTSIENVLLSCVELLSAEHKGFCCSQDQDIITFFFLAENSAFELKAQFPPCSKTWCSVLNAFHNLSVNCKPSFAFALNELWHKDGYFRRSLM